jgi:hypothetical protein
MKHEGFRQEQEFRVLVFPAVGDIEFREIGDRLVPFVDYLRGRAPLPIHEVLIGPGWQLSRLASTELARSHVVQGIYRLLSARGLDDTAVELSSIPYDPR